MKYGIPAEIEAEIRARDIRCVYCDKEMVDPKGRGQRDPRRRDWTTIEHLCSGPGAFHPGQTAEDFAICCVSCNSSRGEKLLADWVGDRPIAPVVQRFMARAREDQFSNRFSPNAAAYRAAWLVNIARPRGKRLSWDTLA
jgi:hypothetical protein